MEPTAPEALQYFVKLAERGAPLLSSSLQIALRQAVLWGAVHETGILPPLDADRLGQALEYVNRAGLYASSGGSVARFVSADAMITPELVLGARSALVQMLALAC